MITILTYDGTFDGFLCCVFEIYDQKLKNVVIRKREFASENFFDSVEMVVTDHEKATRVWKGLSRHCSASGKRVLYKVYLSELPKVEDLMLKYLRKVISSEGKIDKNFADPTILKLHQISKKVDREKHRMDAFVRFQLTKDDIYFATIEPDFNVLPLNASHFKNRYADQQWIIYDLKRNYGIYYNLDCVETVQLQLDENFKNTASSELYFTPEELQFQELWQNYFKSTNITSRKNTKLHLQHVPRRYWKYLSEKKPQIKN